MSTEDAAKRWAHTWKHAWEASDIEAIVALYAADVVFSTEPFREPYRGVAGVREYVSRVFEEEADQRVWVGEPIVTKNRASIAWWAAMTEEGKDVTLAGTSVLAFDASGLVTSQWDTWNMAAGQTSPPGWAPFV
jgi:hypothetical protein